jgi:transmembrane 9 superfamily member 2/4
LAWGGPLRVACAGVVPLMLYFGQMTIFSLTFFLLTGAIGFFSSFWFITKIYSAIKVD